MWGISFGGGGVWMGKFVWFLVHGVGLVTFGMMGKFIQGMWGISFGGGVWMGKLVLFLVHGVGLVTFGMMGRITCFSIVFI